jgi:alpha-maltose-1-phosphate synthase
MAAALRVGVLTREYPPDVYGGAGVHVEFLVRELRALIDVDVHCWGDPRAEPGVTAHRIPAELAGANPALQTLGIDLEMADSLAQAVTPADLLHSHTWYANLAGVLGGQLGGVPHVLTAHSLEPARPWKAEQLGGGYNISLWAERQAYETAAAVIAVSGAMRVDMLAAYPFLDPARVHVIHNGIDTELYAPVAPSGVAARFGIDPDRPSAIFVGRVTRQKGLSHLLRAAAELDPQVQLILCAGAADTPELADEVQALVKELARTRTGVVWIEQMLPRAELAELLTAATVFVCPSIYEPLGIVNLEAMACETAVVASAVGGIPEVVADGSTGLLVEYSPDAAGRAPQFEAGLAAAINSLTRDPERARAMGVAGRERAIAEFSWSAIAAQTVDLYRSVLASRS